MRVTSADRFGSDIRFNFKSVVGLSYRAEYRADLVVGTWQTLRSCIVGSDVQVTDAGAVAPGQRFYQVVVE